MCAISIKCIYLSIIIIMYMYIVVIVDQETYLHQEEDPRYRGAAIPSRAFRFLQNMTDSSDVPDVTCASKFYKK